MIPVVILFVLKWLAVIDILPFKGSTFSLLIIAIIAIIALVIFRFLIYVVIVGVIIVVLLILIFGGIPIPAPT